MKRYCLLFFLWTSCAQETKNESPQPKREQSGFEISYSNGWDERIFFRLTSDSVFYMPAELDSFYHGVVSASTYVALEGLVQRVKNDTTIQSHPGTNCHDCPIVALHIWEATDTLRYFRSGHISAPIDSLVELVRRIPNKQDNKAYGHLLFPTYARIIPPPPHVEPPPLRKINR